MITLKRSMEQVAVGLTLTILGLICLSFALSSQLKELHEIRFLFSGVILILSALYLRYGLSQITPLHRAGYRVAVVMMVWAIGLYFFPYPNAVLYLVIIPGFYFLFRIEIKSDKAPKEDKIAAGLLFLLAIFLYVQQQPLQAILLENTQFDWNIYYQNAPGMVLLGIALTRFQKWLKWDGIATFGTLIVLVATTLSLTLLNANRLPLNELFLFACISHLLFAFIFINNPIYPKFIRFCGVEFQTLNYPLSIFSLLLLLSQSSLLVLLQPYWQNLLNYQTNIGFLNNFDTTASWSLVTLLLTIILPVYNYRSWSVSFVFLEVALVAAFFVLSGSFSNLEFNITIVALLFVSGLLISMVLLKRKADTSHWINNWSFIGVLTCYVVIFFHTKIFTPIGLIGFIFPLLAWGLLPDRPVAIARRFEAYFWPLASAVIILCFSAAINMEILGDWALLTIAAPLALSLAMSNHLLHDIIQRRGWSVLHLWQIDKQKYLLFYALVTLAISIVHFSINQLLFEATWLVTIKTTTAMILSAGTVLYLAIIQKQVRLMLLTELILWSTMALIRWKLETIELLQLGTPIDGYFFIGIAILVAGLREKMRDYGQHFSAYFFKSSIIYGLLGWMYLIYLHLSGAQPLHGELASVVMAGLFYWLSQGKHKSLKILVFIFANIGLFLFCFDNEYNNLLVYLTPALASALILTQMFKDELSSFQVSQIRLYCGLILLGVSAAYNILDFRASVWYPATAAMMAALIVVLGISLRVRIFLYLGSCFILVNIIGMIANVIVTQPPEKTMFAVGLLFLITGVLFVASYLLFQIKREEIKQKYQHITGTIAKWE